jgi:ABC-type multidrug transport system ATPase subunit
VNAIEAPAEATRRAGLQESLARTLPLRSCSAGMKRRFQFARLFMLNRPVALLDEPEAHLDAAGLALVKDSLWKLKERGATILLATHAVDAFADLASARFRLVSGRLTPSA